jgi:hypothetical protein
LAKVSRRFASTSDPNSRYSSKKSGSNGTELITIGGSGAAKNSGHVQISEEADDQFGVQTYIERGRNKGDLEHGSSDDELPLRPGNEKGTVIRINRQFERSIATDNVQDPSKKKYSSHNAV